MGLTISGIFSSSRFLSVGTCGEQLEVVIILMMVEAGVAMDRRSSSPNCVESSSLPASQQKIPQVSASSVTDKYE